MPIMLSASESIHQAARMKAKDLAWLASVADDSKLIYDRKNKVVAELQAVFQQAKDKEIPSVFLEVKTSWQVEQDRKAEEEKHE